MALGTFVSAQSQETERKSGNTGHLHKNLHVIFKGQKAQVTAQNTGIIFKNMVRSEENQLHGGDFHAIQDKVEVDINWEWVIQHQEYFYRKILASNHSSAPKYIYTHCHFQYKLEALIKTDSVTDFRNMFQANYKLTEAVLVSSLSWTLDKFLFPSVFPKNSFFQTFMNFRRNIWTLPSW